MKASILAVGTELTTGQIVNRNAASISEKLNQFGVQVLIHVTIPDDRGLILEQLKALENRSDLIFVTGGLGPTSDDFTREVIADWLQKPLQFDPKSWEHINQRLSSRGYQVKEIQKQQCYYPADSIVLENKEGTAHGFRCSKLIQGGKTKEVFVLPGPPREIESVWNDHIHSWLKANTQQLNRRITKAWDTMGVGESDVATQVEEVLAQFPKSKQLEIGYRVHLPYVEVKITYDENQAGVFQETLFQVNEKLKKITITRDFEDVANTLVQKISQTDFTFYDFVSKGYLHTRLSAQFKKIKQWSFKQAEPKDITLDFFENEDDFLALLPYEEFTSFVVGSFQGNRFQKIIEAPMKSPLMQERRQQYFSEMALVEFVKAMK